MEHHAGGNVFTKGLFAFFQQASRFFARDGQEVARNDERPRRAMMHYEYMLPMLLELADEKPNLKLLDVGCGSGSITIDVAKYIPRGQVTGLDISGAILESAKVHAEGRGVSNVDFVKGDVHDLPFGDGAFDVVCTHQALSHFHDHARAIRELVRVTREGGIVCLREGDLKTGKFSEGYHVLDECFGVVVRVHEGNGGTSDAGRRLTQWAREAGVGAKGIVATRSVWIYDTLEGRREYGGHWPARCTQGVFAERAGELGVSSEKLEEYAVAWKKWIEDPDASFSMVHGEVIVRV